MDEIMASLRRQTKEIQENQNDLTGIGKAWNELIAPMGFDKIKHIQYNQQGQALQNTLKDWKQNKK